MKNQKICIVGDGLAGLTTALTLKELNIDIDLFYKKKNKNLKNDKRTTAISLSNYQFLRKLIKKNNLNYFWPCKYVSLFYETKNQYINFLNYKEEEKNLMYIFENKKFANNLVNELKAFKNINFINGTIDKIDSINSYLKYKNKKKFYDLIILCAGGKNIFYKQINRDRSIKKDYKEFAITCNVQHKLKLKGASQYFLSEGPLAILPIKKNMFSLVWSLSNDYKNNDKKALIQDKLRYIFGKQIKIKVSKIQMFPLHLDLKTRYFKKNILVLGQGIHSIHPIAGQGFNLIIRDIKKLSLIIKKNLELGLGIKNSNILVEFYQTRNPENTLIGIGNDLIRSFFKPNKFIDPIKLSLLKNFSKNKNLKRVSQIISDKGLFF
tara:strand:- start:5093 stop:6229 length:1137 start_codon:yes stop_codon:yes gene_type:complete